MDMTNVTGGLPALAESGAGKLPWHPQTQLGQTTMVELDLS
jgi:hypothetical protein